MITLINLLLIALQVLFIARFHLEISSVNAMIEPVNTIRRLTNPVVLPMKRLIPFVWAKKFAAIKVAFALSFIIILLVNQRGIGNAFITALLYLIDTWISFLQYGMFIYVIGSWIQLPALQRVNYLLHSLFQPMLQPIQRVLPSFAGLDFSPIVFLLLLSFVSTAFSNAIAQLLY